MLGPKAGHGPCTFLAVTPEEHALMDGPKIGLEWLLTDTDRLLAEVCEWELMA